MTDEKIQITVDKKHLDFLVDLMTKIGNQDNRGTAFPYFYIMRQPRWRVIPEGYGYGETKHIFYDSECCREHETKEDYIKECIEEGIPAKEAYMKAEELQEGWLEQYYEEDNMFLTEEGYNKHLKLNRHNLKDPHNYIKCAWRNPEITDLFKALIAITGVDPEAICHKRYDERKLQREAEKRKD